MTPKVQRKIESVTIRRMIDESPDTSWLGEYSASPSAKRFTIDRKHSLDCPVNHHFGPVDSWPKCQTCKGEGQIVCSHGWHSRTEGHDYCPGCGQYSASQSEMLTVDCDDCESSGDAPCDCDEHGDMRRDEYRYFIASENYDGETPEDALKYTLQDYGRMEQLNRGHWCFVGLQAEARVAISLDGGQTFKLDKITSGGLWGIESDDDKSYFAEVAEGELSQLKGLLAAYGFGRTTVARAIKNVQEGD